MAETRVSGVPIRWRASVSSPWIAIVVGVVFALLGGLVIAIVSGDYQEAQATNAWPATSGQVLWSDVEEDVSRKRESDGSIRTRRSYTPVISYEYVVDGTAYKGHRIWTNDDGGSRNSAFDTINRYPVGSDVFVYYDPDDPGSAVLERGANQTKTYLLFGVGGVFALVGVGAVVGTLVMMRRRG